MDSEDDVPFINQYEKVCGDIAQTLGTIASEGVQAIRDQEATFEEQALYGSS